MARRLEVAHTEAYPSKATAETVMATTAPKPETKPTGKVGRIPCSLNQHKWWAATPRDFDPARSANIDGLGRVSGQQVEYRCTRCGKRRNDDYGMPPG